MTNATKDEPAEVVDQRQAEIQHLESQIAVASAGGGGVIADVVVGKERRTFVGIAAVPHLRKRLAELQGAESDEQRDEREAAELDQRRAASQAAREAKRERARNWPKRRADLEAEADRTREALREAVAADPVMTAVAKLAALQAVGDAEAAAAQHGGDVTPNIGALTALDDIIGPVLRRLVREHVDALTGGDA